MRRIGWLPPPIAASRSAVFSTFSGGGGGGGRGRGRGGGFVPPPPVSPSQPDPYSAADDGQDSFPSGAGHGRGRGSLPVLPSFLSPSPLGRGRGRGGGGVTHPTPPPPPPPPPETLNKKPIFFRQTEPEPERGTGNETLANEPSKFSGPDDNENPQPRPLPGLSSGGGRGMPLRPPPAPAPDASAEPNRHVRSRKPIGATADGPSVPAQPKMNREDAVKKAMEVLSRGRGGGGPGRGEGRGMARGRGRGMGARGRGGRGRGGRGREEEEEEEDYWGDPADAEKVEKRLGADKMKLIEEGFDDMSWRVLPPPLLDEYFNAWDTNNMIEYEPEYLVEFDKNPDIDEKPPISLEEALEKAKPFLVAYEGIQSQEEWEEVIKETMEKLPVMKELIDSYCGPDRVTAKQQQQELERVAKTLPENVPSSVKRFTDRAVLSLQSNPGWGFDKKCQFMDKLVWEVTQHYK
ncbi:putative translation initiation factor IF-2 [Iris pallida]|uniref:Translation initiation factor IF-2 n=1 Tax=Iris pallida TaxID=29817 RepID=A0AAX6HRT2_IRIPA|nr:putative translation initiation factor IF-2 [Iris pallida]